jgi:choline monooxygenase
MSGPLGEKLNGFDPTRPLERASTIPSLWYTDPEIYEAECRWVFGNTWQVAGRAAQVAQPGQFLTAKIADEPILVVRDEAGVLRAFVNVCRHRAAIVVEQPCGRATKFRCRYHGWTYDLSGRLRGVPEFDGVAEFDRDRFGLVGLPVQSWSHWVFVNLGCDLPLTQFLDPLPERTATLQIDRLHYVGNREYVVACNWKVFVDNYLDGGYHVNTIHPALFSVLDYPNYQTEVFEYSSLQSSPMRQPDPGREDSTAASVRTGESAYYWWLFPNFMVNLYSGVMDTNLVQPLGLDRCRVIIDFYFTEPQGPQAEHFMAESIAVADRVQQEDVAICESVQAGLASRFYDTGRFSVRREAGGYHFHQLLARSLAAQSASGK